MSVAEREPFVVDRVQDLRQDKITSDTKQLDVGRENIQIAELVCWSHDHEDHSVSVSAPSGHDGSHETDGANSVVSADQDGEINRAPESSSGDSDEKSPLEANEVEESADQSDLRLAGSPSGHQDEFESRLCSDGQPLSTSLIEFRFLVRRREAGALIGKRGANIKRLRDSHANSTFSIPDTGNGPERIVCIKTDPKSQDSILVELTKLFLEKSPENDEQIELKLLIHSSHAGLLIGVGGQSIKKLRNDSKAAIKIYEMCCPLSSERVCAIKAKPPVVVEAIKLISSIIGQNPPKGTVKSYDALHFNLNLVDKYGGYLPDELLSLQSNNLIQQQQFSGTTNGGSHLVPCCDLPHHQHQPANILHGQHHLTALEQNHQTAFPCLSHHSGSQHVRFSQRQPKHYATIWRSTDANNLLARQNGPNANLRPNVASLALARQQQHHHQSPFNQRSSNPNNLRFQRFHPYSSQLRPMILAHQQQQPSVVRSNHHQQNFSIQSNHAPNNRPVVRNDETLFMTQQNHPATMYTDEQANQIPYNNSTTPGILLNEHRPPASLVLPNNPRQQDHDFQCLPASLASLACNTTQPHRIGQYLRPNLNGLHGAQSVFMQSQHKLQPQASPPETQPAQQSPTGQATKDLK